MKKKKITQEDIEAAVNSPEFEWPFEISGMGGSYEAACRKMARKAVEWLRKHPSALAKWRKTQDELEKRGERFYDLDALEPSHKKFTDAVAAVEPDCTGAMHGAACGHGIKIFEDGWKGYVRQVMEYRRDHQ